LAEAPETSAVRACGAALLDALRERLPGVRDHADATADYAFAIAAELGLNRRRCELVAEAARLHDVGKLYLPPELLREDPPLSAEERLQLDGHPRAGHDLLLGAGVPADVAGWILYQAERLDGAGPQKLSGEAIPLESRIIAVACAYEAATRTMTGDLALAELTGAGGTALDPRAVAALTAVVGRVLP
jgi:HD-GYP domain-containing protein (c-di-GMP phosphodiesterase class II)